MDATVSDVRRPRTYAGGTSPDEKGGCVGRVTLQTIADKVGVSRMTVSNAFSRPDQLSTELRERILAAAAGLGYVGPDPSARALARGTTGAVGVLLWESPREAFKDDISTGFFGALADELGPTGLAITFLPKASTEEFVPARDIPMDGAIVYSCAAETPGLTWLLRRKLPLVFVDEAPVAGATCVVLDEFTGSRAAAAHVVELGHRHVGLLTMGAEPLGVVADAATAGSDYVSRERVRGWLDPLTAAGVRATAVTVADNTESYAYEGARLLLAADDRPTAVLCYSDLMALGVLHAAQDLDLRVPEDVSLVGFDDEPLAQRLRPALTTVRQDVAAKGHAAAAALTRAIARSRTGEDPVAERIVIPTELVVRDSTAPPASA